jgi:hypothetical protein
MSATLQRAHWNGLPLHLGDLFRVHKMRRDKRVDVAWQLPSHGLGWEVRVEINGDLQRLEAFHGRDNVLTAGDIWKAAMSEKGSR